VIGDEFSEQNAGTGTIPGETRTIPTIAMRNG
jgi:hypothetical protein